MTLLCAALLTLSDNISNPLADLTCHCRIIHRIQMYSVHIVCKQIDNLAERIRHSGIEQSLLIPFKFMNDPFKTLRKRGSAHRNHPFNLRRINHRHNPGRYRHIDARNPAILRKPVEIIVIKKQLRGHLLFALSNAFPRLCRTIPDDIPDSMRLRYKNLPSVLNT